MGRFAIATAVALITAGLLGANFGKVYNPATITTYSWFEGSPDFIPSPVQEAQAVAAAATETVRVSVGKQKICTEEGCQIVEVFEDVPVAAAAAMGATCPCGCEGDCQGTCSCPNCICRQSTVAAPVLRQVRTYQTAAPVVYRSQGYYGGPVRNFFGRWAERRARIRAARWGW